MYNKVEVKCLHMNIFIAVMPKTFKLSPDNKIVHILYRIYVIFIVSGIIKFNVFVKNCNVSTVKTNNEHICLGTDYYQPII